MGGCAMWRRPDRLEYIRRLGFEERELRRDWIQDNGFKATPPWALPHATWATRFCPSGGTGLRGRTNAKRVRNRSSVGGRSTNALVPAGHPRVAPYGRPTRPPTS